MAGFSTPLYVDNPADPVNAQWQWNENFRVLSGGTPALLEAALQGWINVIQTTLIEPHVLSVSTPVVSAGTFTVVVCYGWWTQVTP